MVTRDSLIKPDGSGGNNSTGRPRTLNHSASFGKEITEEERIRQATMVQELKRKERIEKAQSRNEIKLLEMKYIIKTIQD